MSSVSNPRNHDVLGYTPAKLAIGKRWYIEWNSWNPDEGKMHRKRVSVPHIKPVTARRKYANDMAFHINQQLSKGWNPFIALNNPNSYVLFDEACEKYCRYMYKMVDSGILKPKTYNGYISYLNRFRAWNKERVYPVMYVYQMKKDVVREFLDWVWIDRGKTARTRDNYLMWLKVFTKWMLEQEYITDDPTASMTPVQGKRYQKNRTVIPREEMLRIKEYLRGRDPYFLLACELLYYCFIRPKEMAGIKVGDVSVAKGTISISADIAKNRKDAIVTLPDCVLKMMLDLEVLTKPCDWYLFSKGHRPGKDYWQPKFFCDTWTEVRKALKLPPEYKFYSLKDTGITDLIRDGQDLLSVRDQARHHSLQMTDLYTPLESRAANEDIRHRESYF
jgi:integrase